MTSALAVEPRPVVRAAVVGIALLAAASVLAEALERAVDDLDSTARIWPPFALLLLAYALAGLVAGRGVRAAPLAHGALAALVADGCWLAVRVAVPVARGDDLGFGGRHVVAGAVLAAGFGAFGAALGRMRRRRRAPV